MAMNFLASGRRGRGGMAPLASINVTSLLDITMVLLISFMIIAPTLQSGIAVDLPEVEESKSLDSKDNTLVVSVAMEKATRAVRVAVNDEEISLENLRERLVKERARTPAVAVVLKGDKAVPWQEMSQVLGAVQASGVQGLSLVTMPSGPLE